MDVAAAAIIKLEFAYVSWDLSCKDATVTDTQQLVQCRRAKNHDGVHAVFGAGSHGITVWGVGA